MDSEILTETVTAPKEYNDNGFIVSLPLNSVATPVIVKL